MCQELKKREIPKKEDWMPGEATLKTKFSCAKGHIINVTISGKNKIK